MISKKYTWQNELSHSITNVTELCETLDISPEAIGMSEAASKQFQLRVPKSYLAKMRKKDPKDPLLLQVLPHQLETLTIPGYHANPLKETDYNPVPGLLHKYQSRALLITTQACAIHCRYCFRRHFPYEDNKPAQQDWAQALHYIQNDSNMTEVILSGGDPLVLNDKILEDLILKLSDISHIKIVRIHSRMPVTLPSRITSNLIQAITKTRLKVVLVTHCNHANELDEPVFSAMQHLKQAGVTLLNQTVLLKNINDNAQTLIELSYKLFDFNILPYYLHLLDKVQGAAHFDCESNQTRTIYKEMQNQLPGYLLPKLVTEIPGQKHKIVISYS